MLKHLTRHPRAGLVRHPHGVLFHRADGGGSANAVEARICVVDAVRRVDRRDNRLADVAGLCLDNDVIHVVPPYASLMTLTRICCVTLFVMVIVPLETDSVIDALLFDSAI